MTPRSLMSAAACAALAAALLALAAPALAGEGHDHGDAAPAAPAQMARNDCPTAVCSCPSRPSASWACARWRRLTPSCRARSNSTGKVLMDPERRRQGAAAERRPHRARSARPAQPGPGGAQGRGAGLRGAIEQRPSNDPISRPSWPSCARPSRWPTSAWLG